MYLQITSKCNMNCRHCGFSCNRKGIHMEWETFINAIQFIRDRDDETISIGGGEPTLHPRFFDILKICLDDFNYVWMATNGSKTKVMRRLSNIIEGCDYESFEREDYCTCGEDPENCECWPDKAIYQDGKLTVALSLDYFHSPINDKIVELWKNRSKCSSFNNRNNYQIRDVTISHGGVVKSGRAIRSGVWQDESNCICPNIHISPNGDVKLCGCRNSPILGNVNTSVDDESLEFFRDNDIDCIKSMTKKLRRIYETKAYQTLSD
jgi:MoaA/NifB/PqqE/SkfB family radical SAM enzyme